MNVRNYIPTLAFLFLVQSFSLLADNNWTSNSENPKAFIENKGQFHTNNGTDKVLYAYDNGGTMIYFTPKGLVYRFMEVVPKDRDEKEREEEREREKNFKTIEEWKAHEAEEHKVKYKIDYVNFYWENTNPSVQLIGSETTTDYHSYTFEEKGEYKNINYIKGFKKLTYKNLYTNIDVEYVFHPTDGIKYTIIVHPGADVSKIKMKYDNASINSAGEILVPTLFGNLTEHTPITFYENNKQSVIGSRFVKDGQSIRFQLDSYDASKTIYIDPWVQTPTLSNSNCVWECERDGAGNVYMIGGDMPMKLRKYNSIGGMQWTYNTPWDTANGWLGTLATDLAGNSYITRGSAAAIQKINTSGSMQYNLAGGSMDEYWNITFNCDQTKLIVGGSSGVFSLPPIVNGAIFDINTANGSVLSTKVVSHGGGISIPPAIQEVRAITSSRNAKYYYLTLDTVGCVNQNFSACSASPPLFAINDGYALGYKCENYRPSGANAGIKAIKANKNFVYTQNGANIQKRSLTTGAVITSVAIPGGNSVSSGGQNQLANAGIDIDSCGNVYVGSENAVIKYDANLTQLSSTSLPFKVYDVAVSTGGDVIVCGGTGTNANTSRTGYIQSINMSACDPMVLECCDATICPAGPYCSTDAPVTLSPVVAGGTWSGTGITNASAGTFDPSVAGAGTHTIIYTLPCGSDTMEIIVSSCIALTACQETNGNITATSGIGPHTWSNQSTSQDCSGCLFGNCGFPPGCEITVTAWTSFATGTTITPSGTYPIRLLDTNGDTLTITSLSALPACPATNCPTITSTFSNIVNVSCQGLSDGSFDVVATGGISPYDYTLNITGGAVVSTFSDVAVTQSFTGLAAGDYTLYALDSNGCADTIEIIITEPSAGSVTVNAGPDQTVCSNSAILAGNTPSSGTGLWTVLTGTATINTPSSATSAITGVAVGTATLVWTITDGCASAADTVSITNTGGGPVITISSFSNITCNGLTNGSATATATGGTGTLIYVWAPTGGSTETATNLQAGTYTVSVSDGGGCTGIETVTIIEPTAITVNVASTPAGCTGGGSATASATGGTGNLIYAWSSGESSASINNLSAGSYTVTVTDSMSCTASATATITSAGSITATISASDTIGFGESIPLTANGGSSYLWTPSTGLDCSNCPTPIATPLESTVYCVIVSDNGCTDTACVTITVEEGNCETNLYTGGAFYIPSAFTPNNDVLNDYFKPFANCIRDYKMMVFDRWGEKLFETSNLEEGWNGYYKGALCRQDVYVYKISFIDETKSNYHEYVGKFLLVK